MISMKIAAIIVVAIVAVAAVGVALTMGGGGDRISINAKLEVYGNADNDDKIDQKDIDVIKDIISGKKQFSDYPLADANCDGKVDEADIEMVQKIMSATATSKVRVNHINHFDGKSVVVDTLYPITSAVSTGAANSILVYKYLGIVDEIKGLSYSVVPDVNLFPEYGGIINEAKRLETSSTRINVDKVSNLVTSEKVSAAITADNRSYLANEEKTLEAMGVDVVRIQPATVNSEDYMSSILLIAFLFDTGGKGYVAKCNQLITWYEDFLTNLNGKLQGVSKKVSAVASSSNTTVSTSSSDYTAVLTAAGATFPLTDIDAASASANYDGKSDTWLNKYDLDYVICLRTSATGFSWYEGNAVTAGKATLSLYVNNFKTLECFSKKNVYVVCGDMPVMLRIAYSAEIFYKDAVGAGYADGVHADFVKKFFGWSEDKVKGKAFYAPMDALGISP